MKTVASTFWQREHLDDVPEYGVAVVCNTDSGESVFEVIKYVPERTCKPKKITVTNSFYDYEYTKEFEVDGCPYCEIPLSDDWNYCHNCGAKVVE